MSSCLARPGGHNGRVPAQTPAPDAGTSARRHVFVPGTTGRPKRTRPDADAATSTTPWLRSLRRTLARADLHVALPQGPLGLGGTWPQGAAAAARADRRLPRRRWAGRPRRARAGRRLRPPAGAGRARVALRAAAPLRPSGVRPALPGRGCRAASSASSGTRPPRPARPGAGPSAAGRRSARARPGASRRRSPAGARTSR
jgi:hypothetical protein